MARYDENSKHWNYLKIRGPTFLVSDKFGQLKLAIMNQLAIECSVVAIQPDNRLELRTLEDGWILNYAI